MTDDLLLYERRGDAIWLTMNRPDVRNALSRELVQALRDGLRRGCTDDSARAIVLAGAGPVFCAGADVNQYREAFDRAQVIADGARLFDLLEEIQHCAKPVIARVQRAAFGGAVGLVAAADLVVATEGTRISLSEARLGLVPAVISTTVVRAIGSRQAKALMLLAEPFGPDEALRIGLIHRIVPEEQLDAAIDDWLQQIRANAPGALRDSKELINTIVRLDQPLDELRQRCVVLAADRRVDAEGQEGLTAFLEKRRPGWNPEG